MTSAAAAHAHMQESENHVLDRHQQLHDEIETLKDNLRAVNDDIEQLTAAVVVAAPSITNTQALPGLIKQSVIVQASPSSGNIQRPSTAAGSTTSPLASSTSSAVLPAPGLPSQY